jgi:hypothetical protein
LFLSFFFLSFLPYFLHPSVYLFFIRLLIYLFFILSSFFPLQFSSSLRPLTCIFLRSFIRYSFNCFIRSFVLSLLLSFIYFLTQLFINLSFPSKHYRRHPTPRHLSQVLKLPVYIPSQRGPTTKSDGGHLLHTSHSVQEGTLNSINFSADVRTSNDKRAYTDPYSICMSH